MRSGREIIELQNTERFLRMLKAQRQLHSEAKRVRRIATIICLGFPLLITLCQVTTLVSLTTTACAITELVLFVIGRALLSRASDKTRTAASIQQRFDLKLYGLGSYDCSGLSESIVEASRRFDESGQNSMGLEGWYSSVKPSFEPIKAVRCCQRENVKWSFSLGRAWLLVFVTLCAACLGMLIVLTVVSGLNYANLFFGITIVERASELVLDGTSKLRIIRNLDSASGIIAANDEGSIGRIQNDIFEYRRSSFDVPNWFFESKKVRYASIGDDIARSESL